VRKVLENVEIVRENVPGFIAYGSEMSVRPSALRAAGLPLPPGKFLVPTYVRG
jgi:hypothetical protein